MKKLVSIIVPVYKTEKYLNRCIESIVKQTYKNLEIILVDDESPDSCPAICDDWAKKDKRIKVIHKQNGGVSSARNAGLKVSNGEFIQFVDSDDYLKMEYCENLMKNFDDDVDLVVGGFTIINDKKHKVIKKGYGKEITFVLENINNFLTFVKNGYFDIVCNKIYRKSLITKLFKENQPLGEDRIFNLYYFKNIKNKIIMAESCDYIYEFNSGSACHKKRKDVYDILLKPMKELELFLEEKFGTYENEIFYELYFDVLTIRGMNKKEFKELYLKLNDDEIYKKMKNIKFKRFKYKVKLFVYKHKCYYSLKFLNWLVNIFR